MTYCILDGNCHYRVAGGVGRKMQYPERREAAFEAGTLARIEAVLHEGEERTAFIREAVAREIERREAAGPQESGKAA